MEQLCGEDAAEGEALRCIYGVLGCGGRVAICVLRYSRQLRKT